LILGLKSKATHKPPPTDCKTIEKKLKKLEKTLQKYLTSVKQYGIIRVQKTNGGHKHHEKNDIKRIKKP
jgi:hypothetical protein